MSKCFAAAAAAAAHVPSFQEEQKRYGMDAETLSDPEVREENPAGVFAVSVTVLLLLLQ